MSAVEPIGRYVRRIHLLLMVVDGLPAADEIYGKFGLRSNSSSAHIQHALSAFPTLGRTLAVLAQDAVELGARSEQPLGNEQPLATVTLIQTEPIELDDLPGVMRFADLEGLGEYPAGLPLAASGE